jgi:C-terminal of NADH-ubiquinone oxidoreductase 21 kDa subunit
VRLYGWTENNREVEMDMREMVDKVKKGEPLYGQSDLTPYMQGVAARNSRYSALLAHVLPWGNFVNHNQVRPSLGEARGDREGLLILVYV